MRLKDWLKSTGKTNMAFSFEAEVSISSIQRILRGHAASYRVAEKVSAATHGKVSTKELMRGEKKPSLSPTSKMSPNNTGLAHLLTAVAAKCETDKQLQAAIKALKKELARRKLNRHIERVRSAAKKLTEAERKAIEGGERDRILNTTDDAVRDRLRKNKLVCHDSYYLTMLGRNVAYLIEQGAA